MTMTISEAYQAELPAGRWKISWGIQLTFSQSSGHAGQVTERIQQQLARETEKRFFDHSVLPVHILNELNYFYRIPPSAKGGISSLFVLDNCPIDHNWQFHPIQLNITYIISRQSYLSIIPILFLFASPASLSINHDSCSRLLTGPMIEWDGGETEKERKCLIGEKTQAGSRGNNHHFSSVSNTCRPWSFMRTSFKPHTPRFLLSTTDHSINWPSPSLVGGEAKFVFHSSTIPLRADFNRITEHGITEIISSRRSFGHDQCIAFLSASRDREREREEKKRHT